ncbi:MAG TPA: RNA polymerase-binding ATPase, partial [Chthoniobacteraceae bacterium]
EFFSRLLDHFGVHVEELGSRSFLLLPGHLITDAFPSLPAEGMSVTFDRARALSREDLGFMSGDHPLVGSSFDLLLASEAGNSAFAIWRATTSEAVLLEVYIVVECVAPAALHVDRFLPATPVRIVVDHALADKTDDPALLAAQFETGDVFKLLDRGAVKRKLLPAMLEKVQAFAAERMQELTASASGRIERQLQGEIDRLEDLRRINDHVRPEEIAAAKEQKAALLSAVATANFRLDAVRLILGMPA